MAHVKLDVQIAPGGQFAAVRHWPGTQPPDTHR
jgi:hypothetical protein